jgi:CRISPR-associated protein Csd2
MSIYEICGDPKRRHDFILLFEVTDGNPNGDPDAGNLPRVDPETMQGLVTDVCLKRKVRNYVSLAKQSAAGYGIYINDEGKALNRLNQNAYDEAGIKSAGSKQPRQDVDNVQARMCKNYYDIRMFGAVMTTKVNAGQVRGPLQMTFARSVSPVIPMDISITRVAITKEEDAKVVVGEDGSEGKGGKTTEIGRKPIVPYGLYVGRGFYSVPFAEDSGASREDLELYWTALINMWDLDHSASRGLMACRGLYVFSHEDRLGNAPAHTLFSRFEVELRKGTEAPRQFEHYKVAINGHDLPDGVTLTKLVGD